MDPHESFPSNSDSDPPFEQEVGPSNPLSAELANPYLTSPSPLPPPPFAASGHPSGTRPRWWTPFAVAGISLVVFLFVSTLSLLAAVIMVAGKMPTSPDEIALGLEAALESRTGLVLLVIPQFFMVMVPLAAAFASPVETRERLGLVSGRWPVWAWIAAAAATPLVGLASGSLLGLFVEESESLKQMSEVFRDHGQNGFLFPLAMMIGLTPAVCEEILFRGYIQTRLTRSFTPIAGILISSFMFAVFHMDFVHVIAVFPLGLFLGWISWRSGSLYPAMLAHFVNNVISVVAVVFAPEDATDVLGLPTLMITSLILVAGLVGMGAVVFASVVYGSPEKAAQAA